LRLAGWLAEEGSFLDDFLAPFRASMESSSFEHAAEKSRNSDSESFLSRLSLLGRRTTFRCRWAAALALNLQHLMTFRVADDAVVAAAAVEDFTVGRGSASLTLSLLPVDTFIFVNCKMRSLPSKWTTVLPSVVELETIL
jgi:hypothetical protein